ncbi:MAG TPA: hypothetical protein VNZ06_07295, partial [Steroidobacteraceae bacterium]|nr:hypothetical protein [Steroidobacteraceae bacterium]
DGEIWYCKDGGPGVTLFRLTYPEDIPAAHRYSDSKEFLDLLLKGINLPRQVGTQAVRITSLGAAQQDALVHDHYGRTWQLRIWSLGFADVSLLAIALPTPDGYVGMASVVPGGLQDLQAEQIKFIADYFYLTYRGTLAQWQAFLARRDLMPDAFERVKLQYSPGGPLHLESARLQLDTTGLVNLDAKSSLDLQMNYLVDRGKSQWDIAGVVLRPERGKKSHLALYRQSKPADDATKERRDRWEHMSQRNGEFAGTLQHDDSLTEFWIRTVAAGPGAAGGAGPLYEVVYDTDRQLLPRDMEQIRARMPSSFKITE